MSEEPLVSIIIPTYNRAHLIGETLDSIIAQTYKNWECIVVDDGSTEETDKVMKTYCEKDSRFKYFHRADEHLPGGNGARNYGFKKSAGEYVNWFDSDDLMVPEKIEKQLDSLRLNDSHVTISQCSKFFKNKSNIKDLMSDQIYSENIFEDFVKRTIKFFTPSVLIKREFLKLNKLFFDEDLKAAQEWEFFSRMLFLKPRIAHTSESLSLIRVHEESMSESRNNPKNIFQYINARIKVYFLIVEKTEMKSLHLFFKRYFKNAYFRLISVKEFEKAHNLLESVLPGMLSKFEISKAYFYLYIKQNFNKGESFKKYIFNE